MLKVPNVILTPLTEEWINQKKELIDSEYKSEYFALISVLHTCNIFIDTLDKKNLKNNKLTPIQKIAIYFFSHSFQQAHSVYQISKLGNSTSCMILNRSLLEAVIDLSYLWLCKLTNEDQNESERSAWLEYSIIEQKNMICGIENFMSLRNIEDSDSFNFLPYSIEDRDSINENHKIFKEKYERSKWAKLKIEQRARKVDDTGRLYNMTNIYLEYEYQLIYRYTSGIAHGQFTRSEYYFKEDDNGLNIDFGGNNLNMNISLPMTAGYMETILHIVNHLFHLNININKQIEFSNPE